MDTHCHLFLMEQEPAEVVGDARRAGVERLVCVGIDVDTSVRSQELAESFRGVFATAGVHPQSAAGFDRQTSSRIEELLADPLVVGVGETGLDYYRMRSEPEAQRRAFRAHLAVAREVGKPVVVHTRDAWDDVLAILEEERAERVVLHCFSGDAAVAREASARGYFCSFAGNLTFPKNAELRGAVAEVLPSLLLAETDSPFLTPQVRRGEPNVPGNVRHVVEALAEVRGEDPGAIARGTSKNARRAFGFPP